MKHEIFQNGQLISSREYFKYDTIEEYKKYLIDKLDEVTTKKILSTPFEFDGSFFSMSSNAQSNWSNIKQQDDGDFPLPITTYDDNIYMLSLEDCADFYRAASAAKKEKLFASQIKKMEIKSLTTLQECEDYELSLNINNE